MSSTRRVIQTAATLFEAATSMDVEIELATSPSWLEALEERRLRGLRLADERAKWNGSRRSR